MEEQDFDFEWLLHLVSHEESAETESVEFFDPLELLMELDPLEDWENMLQSETVFQQRGNPVSRSFVDNLPLVYLLEVETCGICMEDMLVGDLIKMLPVVTISMGNALTHGLSCRTLVQFVGTSCLQTILARRKK